MDVKNTRLRFIAAKTAGEISLAVSSLPFKVEIKGNPVFDGTSDISASIAWSEI